MGKELFAGAIARLAEVVGRLPYVEIHGAENIYLAQSHLSEGGSVLVCFLPHTHTLDPIVLNEIFLRPELAPYVKGKFGFPASVKFTQLVAEMDTMGMATVGSKAYADRSGFELIPIFQPYLLGDPRYAHLTDTADRINLKALLQMKRIIKTPSSLLVIAPEGTRNKTNGLLRADQNISGLISRRNTNLLVLPLTISGMRHQEGHLFKMATAKIALHLGPILDTEQIYQIAKNHTWLDESMGDFSPIDALMFHAVSNLPLDTLSTSVDPRGVYDSINILGKAGES